MRLAVPTVIVSVVAFSACAPTAMHFEDERTVFNNPYAPPELANGPVGPECSEGVIRDQRCWIDGVAYPLPGLFVRDSSGNLVRLSRKQRREVRERRESIQSRIDILKSLENGTPIPPDSPALPENQRRPVPPPTTFSDFD